MLTLLVLLTGWLLACGETTTGEPAEATVRLPTPTQAPAAPTEPTAEPPPTVAPSPTPVPSPAVPPLEIRAGYDYLSFDYLHILGEVVNNSDQWYEFVEIIGSFYDADGTMLDTDFTYTMLDKIPPGGRGVFNLMSNCGGAAADVASYELQVEGSPTRTGQYTDLTAEVTNEYEEFGYYHLVGQVSNVGSLDCEFVQVIAAFYDSAGNVVGVDFAYTQLDRVPAGGSSPFEIMAGEVGDFTRYEVWVEGEPVRD